MIKNSSKNNGVNNHKNIRQAFQESEQKYKRLADAYMQMQRMLKYILLTIEQEDKSIPPKLYYKNKVSRHFTVTEIDEMKITVKENEELEQIEISI